VGCFVLFNLQFKSSDFTSFSKIALGIVDYYTITIHVASLIREKNWYYLQFYSSNKIQKQIRIALKTRTKNTAIKLKRSLKDEYATGAFNPWQNDTVSIDGEELSKNSTFKESLDQYIKHKSKNDWRPKTAKTAKYVLEDFVSTIGNEHPVGAITEKHFNAFLNRTDMKPEARKSHKKKLNIHSLRHTCCIELLRAGVPIYTYKAGCVLPISTTQWYADMLNMDIIQ